MEKVHDFSSFKEAITHHGIGFILIPLSLQGLMGEKKKKAVVFRYDLRHSENRAPLHSLTRTGARTPMLRPHFGTAGI